MVSVASCSKSDSGSFTAEQQKAVAEAMTAWTSVPHVQRVVDPFEAQAQIDSTDADLAAATAQLDDGRAQLDRGTQQLTDAKGQLSAGEAFLAQLRDQNPDDPRIPGLEAQVQSGRQQVADGEQQLADSEKELLAGEQQYSDGKAVAEASAGTRLVSEDGRHAVVQVQFDDDAQSIPAEDRARIPEQGDPILEAAGITPSYSVEITQDIALVGPGEVLGLSVALLVLVLVLGSLIAAGLPLLVALLGVGVGLGGAVAFTSLVELNSTTPSLALMLGLAVGIDYALFIVNRHRANILHGMPLRESVPRAVATAGSAVTFAGATVVIALGALVLSGIPILAEMGVVAAVTVALTVLVAITVSPAVMRLMGTRVVSRRGWRRAGFATPGDPDSRGGHPDDRPEEHGGWYVGGVTRHPWLTLAGVVAVVGVLAIPALDMRLGLPDGGSEPTGSSAYTAYTAVADEFGPGMNGPVVAVAELPSTGSPRTDAEVLHEQARIATALADVEGVVSVVPFGVSDDTDTLAFQVVPSTGPADEQTPATIDGIRRTASLLDRHDGVAVGLTGQTVANIEISDRLAGALPAYLAVVVGLSLLILTLVFRSVVVPLVATGGFLLSVAAAFGATVAVHQWGWLGGLLGVTQPGPLLSLHADHPHRGPLRPRDGLPDVPRLRHARGPRPRGGLPLGRALRLRPRRPGRHRGGDHHDLGLPRLRLQPPRDGPPHRVRARGRRPHRRLPHPDDADPRGHAPPRRPGLVDPPLARPAPARPRRRGAAARSSTSRPRTPPARPGTRSSRSGPAPDPARGAGEVSLRRPRASKVVDGPDSRDPPHEEHTMDTNVGSRDKQIRLVAAVVAVVAAFAIGIGSVLGIVLVIVGVVLGVTAVTGFCPLYRAFGMSTRDR